MRDHDANRKREAASFFEPFGGLQIALLAGDIGGDDQRPRAAGNLPLQIVILENQEFSSSLNSSERSTGVAG